MIKAIIISGLCFTVGNIVWLYFNEPKIFYIPLAVFIFLLVYNLWKTYCGQSKVVGAFIEYLMLLAGGNIVKQIFYSDAIKQINDYIWGGFLTAILIIRLWVIHKQQHGKR